MQQVDKPTAENRPLALKDQTGCFESGILPSSPANQKVLEVRDNLLSSGKHQYTNGTELSLQDNLLLVSWTSQIKDQNNRGKVDIALRYKELSETEQIDLLTKIDRAVAQSPTDEIEEAPLVSVLIATLLESKHVEQMQASNISGHGLELITDKPLRSISLNNLRMDHWMVHLDCGKLELELLDAKHSSLTFFSSGGEWHQVSIDEKSKLIGDFGETIVDKSCEFHSNGCDFDFSKGIFEEFATLKDRLQGLLVRQRFMPDWQTIVTKVSKEEAERKDEEMREDYKS